MPTGRCSSRSPQEPPKIARDQRERASDSTASHTNPYHRATVNEHRFTEARLLTVNEVAGHLRVSRMTVYRLIKEGDMKALRVGRSYRLREDDVDDYLSQRYTEAG
jgi:excisionase family DNA binding protein